MRRKLTPNLSSGERRLARLAAACAALPPVLVLDEPTNDLDPLRRRHVWDVMRHLNSQHGTTILFITHDAIEAERIIQRVGIMRAGKLVAIGRPVELKAAIDRKLRMELFFSPDAPPHLPEGLDHRALDAGRWLVWLEREQLSETLAALDVQQLDDLRLYSATLEDLYIHYANHT